MGLRQTTAPAEEPISLDQAKLHLRVDEDDDDSLILMLISAARLHAETECDRVLVTQGWDLFLDRFPVPSFCGGVSGVTLVNQGDGSVPARRDYNVRIRAGRISLPFPRLQTVDSVKYIDVSGVLQTIDPSLYVVDNVSEPGVLVPAPGTSWPATQQVVNAVQISYTAGYGDAGAVPAGIKSWMLMRIGAMYENREEIVVGSRLTSVEMPFVDGLLGPYRLWRYV